MVHSLMHGLAFWKCVRRTSSRGRKICTIPVLTAALARGDASGYVRSARAPIWLASVDNSTADLIARVCALSEPLDAH